MDIHFINLKDANYDLQVEVRDWRNASDVAKYFQIDYISLEAHKDWLESLKCDNPRNIAYIIMANNFPVGLCYFSKIDMSNLTADWGVFIKRDFINKGIGFYVEYKMHEIAFFELMLFKLNISVLENNQSVIKMHQKFGYKIDGIMRKNIKKYGQRLDVYLMSLMNDEWLLLRNKFEKIMAKHR